jgi:hypothetical protein
LHVRRCHAADIARKYSGEFFQPKMKIVQIPRTAATPGKSPVSLTASTIAATAAENVKTSGCNDWMALAF